MNEHAYVDITCIVYNDMKRNFQTLFQECIKQILYSVDCIDELQKPRSLIISFKCGNYDLISRIIICYDFLFPNNDF